jgi:Sigma-70, region 4
LGPGEILHARLAALSPDCREIVDLVYYHGKSIDDAAQILGVPATTVKARMVDGRKRLTLPEPAYARAWTRRWHPVEWSALYGARVSEVVSVLQTKGVPVYWVGLPPMRNVRDADIEVLNDIYEARGRKSRRQIGKGMILEARQNRVSRLADQAPAMDTDRIQNCC